MSEFIKNLKKALDISTMERFFFLVLRLISISILIVMLVALVRAL